MHKMVEGKLLKEEYIEGGGRAACTQSGLEGRIMPYICEEEYMYIGEEVMTHARTYGWKEL